MSIPAPRPARPDAGNAWASDHVDLLLASYARLTGRTLYAGEESGRARARAVFEAPFVLLSHGVEPEPLFNYANLAALTLFELSWAQCVQTPSRESAEAAGQDARERFMQSVRERGFVDDYSGVRIASSGRRFRIEGATVWNVIDAAGRYHGQAATFARWRDL